MNNSNQLKRVLTLWDAVAVGLGAITGAGIFVVTGVAAGVSGPSFLLGLLIAGIVATFNALSSAQLAAVYPQSGGTYEYGYRLLNPHMGFAAGWMFLISKLAAAGVVALGFGSYMHQLWPSFSPLEYAVSAILLLTAANIWGIRKAGLINSIIVLITIASLVYFSVSGLVSINISHFNPFFTHGFVGVAESAALLFFAFTGYARIATLAEEVKNPRQTIPRAVIITIITAVILYFAVSFVALGVQGADCMAASDSPLQNAALMMTFPAVYAVITIGATTAMLGVLLSQILGISRMFLAMGRRNDMPVFLTQISHKAQVPYLAIIVTGILILAVTFAGSFQFIVRAAAFTILLYYTITNLAALKQNKEQQIYGKAIPMLGLIGCVLMSLSMPLNVILSGLALLFAGLLLRLSKSWFHLS